MSRARAADLRASPRQQSHWDWRAAGNFIGGGAGSGLLLLAAFATSGRAAYAPLAAAALALIAGGLFCVWLEIGRPLRALNVFRHADSSWMTREAFVAVALFATAAAAILLDARLLAWPAGFLGAAFLYCQARILASDKGIPAWRQPLCAPLLIVTGLTEGAGLLFALQPLLGLELAWPAFVLLVALAARATLWRAYRQGLSADGAPLKTLEVLGRLQRPLLLGGHLLPALLVVLGISFGIEALAVLGAAGAVLAGWMFKYALLRRAGYTQGYALPHVPVRGRGTSAPGVKPGWSKP